MHGVARKFLEDGQGLELEGIELQGVILGRHGVCIA
jgi:hypothetical protein